MFAKVKSFLFSNTSTRQTLVKNTFWLGVSNTVGRLIRGIIIVYAARMLGTEEWGVFAYATALIATITILADFGINSIVTREASRGENMHESPTLSTAFWIKIVFTALSAILLFALGPYLTNLPKVRAILPLTILVLIFDTLRDFGFSITRALQKMEWEAAFFITTNIAIVVLGLIFLWISPTVELYTLSYAVGSAIGTAITFYVLRKHIVHFFRGFSWKHVGPILSSAWPFALAGVLGGLMVNTDVLIIGAYRSAGDIGLYSAAQRLVLFFYIIPGIIASSIFPMISRFAHRESEKVQRIVEFALASVLMVGLPITAASVILGAPLVIFLFGSAYAGGTLSFQILALTIPLNFLAIVISNVIFAHNMQKILIWYAAMGALFNIGLDMLLIPSWGIAGSSAATLIVQTIGTIFLWRAARKTVTFSVFPYLRNMIIGTGMLMVLSGTLLFFGVPVIWNLLFGSVCYVGFLLLRKEPLLKEVRSVFAGHSA